MVAFASIFISYFQDSLYLRTSVVVGIVSLVVVLVFLTKVHSSGKLAYADKIGSVDKFILQRRLVEQALECLHGTDIGEESQFLTHRQQSLLRTHFCCRVVVELRIAYSSKENCVSLLTCLESLLGEWVSHLVDGISTDEGFLVLYLVSKLLCYCVHHSHSLSHYLRTNAVARQYRNL